jgi:hypothetical protein
MSDESDSNSSGDSSNDSSGNRRELSKSKSKDVEALTGSTQRANSKGKQDEATGWSPEDGAGYIPTEEGGSGHEAGNDPSSGEGSNRDSSDE